MFGNVKWLRWEVILIGASVAVSVIFAAVMVTITAKRPLSPLETMLFQIVTLGVGLGGGLFGSYKFGQNFAANKQHARSALRSVIVLHRGILELSSTISRLNERRPDGRFDLLQALVSQLSNVCSSAIADWRDVIPDDFEGRRRNSENGGSNRTDSR